MHKRILVPMDGLALAEAVLPHAQDLANHIKVKTVIPVISDSNAKSKKVGNKGIQTSCLIFEGPIADAIPAATGLLEDYESESLHKVVVVHSAG